jgi:hypothetical protein
VLKYGAATLLDSLQAVKRGEEEWNVKPDWLAQWTSTIRGWRGWSAALHISRRSSAGSLGKKMKALLTWLVDMSAEGFENVPGTAEDELNEGVSIFASRTVGRLWKQEGTVMFTWPLGAAIGFSETLLYLK